MVVLDAQQYDQHSLLAALDKIGEPEIEVVHINGQRYIGCGWNNRKKLILRGTAGNNLGAFADGACIVLHGNGQEGVGNTMSAGEIVVHGRVGDIAGYGMQGGALYIRDEAGYRLGIHMKSYREKRPLIVVGGQAGAFAGEYMAGGTLIIMGLTDNHRPLVGPYCGTGMYDGEIYLRGNVPTAHLAGNLQRRLLKDEEMTDIMPFLRKYADYFDFDIGSILAQPFTRLTPLNQRLYAHIYTGFVS